MNSKTMTAELAINTLKKALSSQSISKSGLILHIDQGSQYTLKDFDEFCESVNIIQSMSKTGYP
ncbi:MAG: transposase family protein [Clostridiaceae bacterium]|nr:transposase family protein [Clostridiaceae bacterium]